MTPCPAGCKSCTVRNGKIASCDPAEGFAIDSTGSLVPCVAPCKTCVSTSATTCTSCFGASFVSGTSCVGCKDTFATSCPDDINYATGCITGYSPFNGACQACATNCLTCGSAGPDKCDTCTEGYVVIFGTSNCTQCYGGCGSCAELNPGSCLTCPDGSYVDKNTSTCQSCSSVCITCTSETVCLSCINKYILSNDFCFLQLDFCISQSNSTCTQCYTGYSITGRKCVATGCNTTATCLSCEQGLYLKSGNCLSCSAGANCFTCVASQPTKCLLCVSGFYIDSLSTCSNCSTALKGCAECNSDSYCTQAADGFYLVKNSRGRENGKVDTCKKGCATCNNGQICLTCATDYTKRGGFCIYKNNLDIVATLTPGTGSNGWYSQTDSTADAVSNNTELADAYKNTNQILNMFFRLTGVSVDNLIIIVIGWGSLIPQVIVSIDEATDPNLVTATMNANIASNNITDFGIAKFSATPSFTGASKSSTVNLGLLLGILIPLIILCKFMFI